MILFQLFVVGSCVTSTLDHQIHTSVYANIISAFILQLFLPRQITQYYNACSLHVSMKRSCFSQFVLILLICAQQSQKQKKIFVCLFNTFIGLCMHQCQHADSSLLITRSLLQSFQIQVNVPYLLVSRFNKIKNSNKKIQRHFGIL